MITLKTALPALVAALIYGVTVVFSKRRFYKNLPQPPGHSLIWGHCKTFEKIAALFPPFTHPQHIYTYMAHKYKLHGIFYVDCWPFVESQVVITDPDAAMQILTKTPYPKHPAIEKFLRPFTGPDSIAASNGDRWKYNHRMVGSGFTPTYIKPMVGEIVDQLLLFHHRLRALADAGESFNMEEETAKAVFDVIGKIVFGFSLEAQKDGSSLLDDLRATISPAATLVGTWNPWERRKAQKSLQTLKDRVHNALAEDMKGRMRTFQDEKELPTRRQARSILDRIVLDRIQSAPGATLDEEFIETAVTNLKALLLGGHGTTTSTFTWITVFLSRNPDVVDKLRREHDELFGPDLGSTVDKLIETPHKTDDLKYTDAVIKETLRFFPIGFTIRQAPADVETLSWNGRDWPVKNLMVIPNAHSSHFDPLFWREPGRFRPERFLGEEEAETHRFSWRAFERGPRACVASGLAMEELRILLLILVRWFDFETVVEGTSERVDYMDLDKDIGDLAFQQVGMEAKPRHDMQTKVHVKRE